MLVDLDVEDDDGLGGGLLLLLDFYFGLCLGLVGLGLIPEEVIVVEVVLLLLFLLLVGLLGLLVALLLVGDPLLDDVGHEAVDEVPPVAGVGELGAFGDLACQV